MRHVCVPCACAGGRLVATLGKSQVDNFELAGTAAPGGSQGAGGEAAVVPCAAAAPTQGAALHTIPCDRPGALVEFATSRSSRGVLELTGDTRAFGARAGLRERAGTKLCIGPLPSGNPTGQPTGQSAAPQAGLGPAPPAPTQIGLVPCGSAQALVFNVSTGRISPGGDSGMGCVTAVQKQQHDSAHAALVLAQCGQLITTPEALSNSRPPLPCRSATARVACLVSC